MFTCAVPLSVCVCVFVCLLRCLPIVCLSITCLSVNALALAAGTHCIGIIISHSDIRVDFAVFTVSACE